MPDKSHARNAKARASQQVKKGNLTGAEKAKIDRKADRILDKLPNRRPSGGAPRLGGPGGGSRTLMPLRAADFESAAYAIPPLRGGATS
jgi:hypothetical protein